MQRLICSQNFDNWDFGAYVFVNSPVDEIRTTPNVALTPSDIEVGKTITLEATAFPTWRNTESYIIGEKVILSGQTWEAVADNTGSQPSASNENWQTVTGSDASVFTAKHIGAIVNINSGRVKITSITSSTKVRGEVLVALSHSLNSV